MALIKTDRNLKDMYKWSLAHFLGFDMPDCFDYLRNIVIVLRGYKEIRDKMDLELGEEKNAVLKSAVEDFSIAYKVSLELRQLIKTSKDVNNNQLASILEVRLRMNAAKLPMIHASLLKAWVAAVKNTDLVLVYTPSDQILQAATSKLNYRSPQRRIETLYGGEER